MACLLSSFKPLVKCRLPKACPPCRPSLLTLHVLSCSGGLLGSFHHQTLDGHCSFHMPPPHQKVRPQVKGFVCFVSCCIPSIQRNSWHIVGAQQLPGGRIYWNKCCWVSLFVWALGTRGTPGLVGFHFPSTFVSFLIFPL